MVFETEVSPIFALKWNKNRAPPVDVTAPAVEASENNEFDEAFYSYHLANTYSPFRDAILEYVAGFIVRKLLEKIGCTNCAQALTSSPSSSRPNSLIRLKDSGGLVYPSSGLCNYFVEYH